jgi:dienelactone hydrolase
MRFFFSFTLLLMISISSLAAIKKEKIEYQHGDVVLEGYLVYDNLLKSKRPGILLVHEWWGLNKYAKSRADQLVNLGYVVFALDMYGKGVVTDKAKKAKELSDPFYEDRQLMRDRAAAGFEVLKNFKKIDPMKLGVVGYCFGGTVALELARSGADFIAVVSFHGGLSTPDSAAANNIRGDVLILHGAADPFVPKSEVDKFMEEMNNAGVTWQLNQYSGAMHAFSNPEANIYKLDGVAYNYKADIRSWEAMRSFFYNIFK